MRHFFILVATLAMSVLAHGQADSMAVVRGRVVCGGRPVPYATLQLKGTSVGVVCNDAGLYELRLPASAGPADSVAVRSMGCEQASVAVGALMRSGRIVLQPQTVVLQEVRVTGFSDARQLLLAVTSNIRNIYQPHTAYSTFFFRDWRAIDDELYLFDEAVMRVRRSPYHQYAKKRGYRFDPGHREMESNIKSLIRHRLLVHDRNLLQQRLDKPQGIDQRLEYLDNETLFDPVATPQASYALARRMLKLHRFEPIREFVADGERFWLVRSVGPTATNKAKARYEYTVRQRDLALVRLVSVQLPTSLRAPDEEWVNDRFHRLAIVADSSVWTYDLRDSAYTLTRYSTHKHYTLTTRGRRHPQQWQQGTEWTLTDFTASPSPLPCPIEVRPQSLADAFGSSDYSSDFWGHHNSVPIDTLPLRLLQKKFNRHEP